MHDGPKFMPSRKCTARSIIRDTGGKPILDDQGNYQFKPCQKFAMVGASVCSIHGGRSAVVKRAAGEAIAIRQAESMIWQKAGDLLDMFGLHDIHPMEGLLDAVRRCYAMMRVIGLMLGELELHPTGAPLLVENPRAVDLDSVDDLEEQLKDPDLPPVRRMEIEESLTRVRSDTKRGGQGIPSIFKLTEAVYGLNHLGDGAPHVLVTMYGEWLDRYQRACKVCLEANIDERLVRQTEFQTDRLFSAVTYALRNCELTYEQQDKFKQALAVAIRNMADDSPGGGLPAGDPGTMPNPSKVNMKGAAMTREKGRVFIEGSPTSVDPPGTVYEGEEGYSEGPE